MLLIISIFTTASILLDCDLTHAENTFQQGRQISISITAMPMSSETISIAFVACDSDPFGPCLQPVEGGCAETQCVAIFGCQQDDLMAMTSAVANAINQMECDGYSAIIADEGLVNVFYPYGICLCLLDSTSGISYPYSPPCSFLEVCDSSWRFNFGFACPTPPAIRVHE